MPKLPVPPQFDVLSITPGPERVHWMELWNLQPSETRSTERAYDYVEVAVGHRGLEPETVVVTRPNRRPDPDVPSEAGAAPASALYPVALTATLAVDLPRAEAQRLLEDLRSPEPAEWLHDYVAVATSGAPSSAQVWSASWGTGTLVAGHFADATFAIAGRKSRLDLAAIELTVVDPDELRAITEPSPSTT